jgi:hypothetical protein
MKIISFKSTNRVVNEPDEPDLSIDDETEFISPLDLAIKPFLKRLDALETRLDALETRLDARIDALKTITSVFVKQYIRNTAVQILNFVHNNEIPEGLDEIVEEAKVLIARESKSTKKSLAFEIRLIKNFDRIKAI